jgi:hypothetical protein
MNGNSNWHPAIMWGKFRDWDGSTPFDEIPLFYEGVDEWTGNTLMMGIGDEMMEIGAALEQKSGGKLRLKMTHMKDWMQLYYPGQIGDDTQQPALEHQHQPRL